MDTICTFALLPSEKKAKIKDFTGYAMRDHIQVTIPKVKMKMEPFKTIDECYLMIHTTSPVFIKTIK